MYLLKLNIKLIKICSQTIDLNVFKICPRLQTDRLDSSNILFVYSCVDKNFTVPVIHKGTSRVRYRRV